VHIAGSSTDSLAHNTATNAQYAAGGKVTDFRGNKLDFSLGDELIGNTGIVCTNGVLHDTVMQAIQKVDAIGILSRM
jgi:3'(2'), 5'-bisphosphate nucleotidase